MQHQETGAGRRSIGVAPEAGGSYELRSQATRESPQGPLRELATFRC